MEHFGCKLQDERELLSQLIDDDKVNAESQADAVSPKLESFRSFESRMLTLTVEMCPYNGSHLEEGRAGSWRAYWKRFFSLAD